MRREPFPGRRVYMCQSLPSVSALGTHALTAPRDAPHCPALPHVCFWQPGLVLTTGLTKTSGISLKSHTCPFSSTSFRGSVDIYIFFFKKSLAAKLQLSPRSPHHLLSPSPCLFGICSAPLLLTLSTVPPCWFFPHFLT